MLKTVCLICENITALFFQQRQASLLFQIIPRTWKEVMKKSEFNDIEH